MAIQWNDSRSEFHSAQPTRAAATQDALPIERPSIRSQSHHEILAERPVGVEGLCILLVAKSCILFFIAYVLRLSSSNTIASAQPMRFELVIGVLGAVMLVCAVGLFRGRRWACTLFDWMLAGYLIITLLVMVTAEVGALPLFIGLMILGRFAIYLHAEPVAVAFFGRRTR